MVGFNPSANYVPEYITFICLVEGALSKKGEMIIYFKSYFLMITVIKTMVHIWSRYRLTSMIKNLYIYIYIYIYIFDMIWKCGFYFYIFHSICPVLSLSLYWLNRLYLINYVSKFQYLNNLYRNISNLVLSQPILVALRYTIHLFRLFYIFWISSTNQS